MILRSSLIEIEILFHYICIDIIIFFWCIILPVNRAIYLNAKIKIKTWHDQQEMHRHISRSPVSDEVALTSEGFYKGKRKGQITVRCAD